MIELVEVNMDDANTVIDIQKQCFSEYLQKYHDDDVNPANETLEHLNKVIINEAWDIYIIKYNGENAGIIKVNKFDADTYKINDFGISPKFRDRNIGTMVFLKVEELYTYAKVWILSTILQESRCIHFYEKLGFKRTTDREPTILNKNMTIVGYKLVR
ncbi:MAG: GNAT family N-acetyltransferase [Clostridium sp.]|uniref:GNAT family N-acetyltransferase n=1 Tax=Clostridium sp. TaxID=1506 RepID=UPI003068D92E